MVATIKVYTKHDISSFMSTTQPPSKASLCEELPVSLETSMEHYNGQNYHTAVLKRLLLYPSESGQAFSVNSGKYDVTIVQYETVNMGFFRTQRPVEREVTTSSNVATLNVKALPEPRPAGFNGAVGHFSVNTRLEPELMRTNEALGLLLHSTRPRQHQISLRFPVYSSPQASTHIPRKPKSTRT